MHSLAIAAVTTSAVAIGAYFDHLTFFPLCLGSSPSLVPAVLAHSRPSTTAVPMLSMAKLTIYVYQEERLSDLLDMLHAPSEFVNYKPLETFLRIGLIGGHCGRLRPLTCSPSIPINGFILTLSFKLAVEIYNWTINGDKHASPIGLSESERTVLLSTRSKLRVLNRLRVPIRRLNHLNRV